MIPVEGKLENGTKEAAVFLNVSEKTVRNYIKNGILPEPPVIRQGRRVLRYFSEEYLEKAKEAITK